MSITVPDSVPHEKYPMTDTWRWVRRLVPVVLDGWKHYWISICLSSLFLLINPRFLGALAPTQNVSLALKVWLLVGLPITCLCLVLIRVNISTKIIPNRVGSALVLILLKNGRCWDHMPRGCCPLLIVTWQIDTVVISAQQMVPGFKLMPIRYRWSEQWTSLLVMFI